MNISLKSVVVAVAFSALSAVQAWAVPVTISLVNIGSSSMHSGMAVDSVTGKVYVKTNFSDSNVNVYNNISDFYANAPSGSITLAGSASGTYIAARNGTLYGREENAFGGGNAQMSSWNAATGARVTGPVTVPGMGGGNFTDTFDWGGFSGVNVMQDSTGMYVVGGNLANTNWQVSKFDPATLAVTSSTTVTTASTLGYGFVINGKFFSGQDYSSNIVSTVVDLTTSVQSVVNFTLTGGPTSPYWTDASYDFITDTLFFRDQNQNRTYKVDGASVAFNAPAQVTTVPAPGALVVLGLGLLGVGGLRIRRKAA